MSQGELRRKRNSRNSMSPSHSAIYLYCVGQATQLHICYIYIILHCSLFMCIKQRSKALLHSYIGSYIVTM